MNLKNLFLVFLLESFALANFDQDIERLESRSKLIDDKIKSFGFSQRQDLNAQQYLDSQTPEKRGPLFTIHDDLKRLRVKLGSVLTATLETRLIVGQEGSPAILKLTSDNSLNGIKILGTALQSSTEGRLQIVFDRLVFENGKSVFIKAQALDVTGAQGLKAQVFSSKALMLAGAMTGSFISGFAASQQTQVTNGFGFTQTQPTARNAILSGVAQTAADQSKRLIEEQTKEKPVLVVDSKTPVLVYFDEEVRF